MDKPQGLRRSLLRINEKEPIIITPPDTFSGVIEMEKSKDRNEKIKVMLSPQKLNTFNIMALTRSTSNTRLMPFHQGGGSLSTTNLYEKIKMRKLNLEKLAKPKGEATPKSNRSNQTQRNSKRMTYLLPQFNRPLSTARVRKGDTNKTYNLQGRSKLTTADIMDSQKKLKFMSTDDSPRSPIRKYGFFNRKKKELEEDAFLRRQIQRKVTERKLTRQRSLISSNKQGSIASCHMKEINSERLIKDELKSHNLISIKELSNVARKATALIKGRFGSAEKCRLQRRGVVFTRGGTPTPTLGRTNSKLENKEGPLIIQAIKDHCYGRKAQEEIMMSTLHKENLMNRGGEDSTSVPQSKREWNKAIQLKILKTKKIAKEFGEEMDDSFLQRQALNNMMENKMSPDNYLYTNRDSYAVLRMNRGNHRSSSLDKNKNMNQKLFGSSTKFNRFKHCSLIFKPATSKGLQHFNAYFAYKIPKLDAQK